MNYMDIKPFDIADGPGVRVGLYVAGCDIRCESCHNQEAWPFDAGSPFGEVEVGRILRLLERPYIRGLSILGGEPLAAHNRVEVVDLMEQVRVRFDDTKDIWLYTGRTMEYILSMKWYAIGVLSRADVVVDGPFDPALADPGLRFRGSSNQRVLDAWDSLMCGYPVPYRDKEGYL